MPLELSLGKVNEEAGTLLTLQRQGLSHTQSRCRPAWEVRGESPGAAEVSFQPCFEFLFRAAGQPGKNGTRGSSPLFNKSVPLPGHMPPSLENGAKADFPGLLGAPDEIICESTL